MEKEVVKLKLKHHHHNPHNNNTNNSSTKTSLRERNIIGEGSDFVLNWGSMKRPRCMKIQVKNHSTPVVRSHNNTSVGNVNRTTNGFNLRQRSASPAQPPSRILRNSEGGSGMKTHHNNYQTNGVGGMKGLASPEREKKSGGAQQYHHNDNHENNMIINGGGKTTSSETKGGESLSGGGTDVVWPPKFMISLTNKEKEEDFMAIKGSKLPQRPKKRAKFIQRTINLVSPGGWLCDLTLERYEVREKKITKKRPRGLKDMGNYVESDSD